MLQPDKADSAMNSINATMARQAFALLSSLILLLIALHWVAANYPTSSPYPSTDIYHVQPGKTALFIEAYRERNRFNFVRIFGMDFDKGTMRELYCPASEGLMWDEICGVDTRGNAICRTRNHHKNNYYRVTPSSGDVQLIAMNRSSLILVGNRFLVDSEAGENTTFVYRDLEEP